MTLLAVGIAALLIFLPRLANSPLVRRRIEAAAHDALGREFQYADLSFGLLPPGLVVGNPQVAGSKSNDPPFLEAEAVRLRLAIAPLLRRTVVINSLVVEGARARLVRTAEGIELPKPAAARSGGSVVLAKPAAVEAGPGFQLAVRSLRLRHMRILLEDRTVSPPVTWDLEDMNGNAHLDSLEGPVTFDLSAALAGGGRLRAKGRAGLDADVDAEVELDEYRLTSLAPYFGDRGKLAGVLSGKVLLSGPAASPNKMVADLVLRQGEMQFGEMGLRGAAKVKLDLEGGFEKARGTFNLDARDASLYYGDVLTKSAGEVGSVAGGIVTDPYGNIEIKDARVRLKNMDAKVRVRTGKRVQAWVAAQPFDLAGWDEWVPALSGYDISGPVALQDLVVTTAPLEIAGSVVLNGVRLQMPSQEPVIIKGTLRGTGESLGLDELTLAVAGQVVKVTGSVSLLGAVPRYDLGVRITDADANQLLSAFSSVRDTLYGPLDLQAQLRGPAGGEREPMEALSGTVQLEIGAGRLKGVSILKSTFDRLGAFGEAALLVGRLRGGRTLRRFYEDSFKSITGTLKIASGRASTDNLQMLYRHYKVDLWGSLGLLDRRLDMRGRLTIFKGIDQELADAGTQPSRKTIPLARVIGTLDSPRVDLSSESVAQFAASYAIARHRRKLEEKMDEKLGRGSGKQVIDLLEGILGGQAPRR